MKRRLCLDLMAILQVNLEESYVRIPHIVLVCFAPIFYFLSFAATRPRIVVALGSIDDFNV